MASVPSAGPTVTVLYGSQTSNGKGVAEALYGELQSQGFTARLVSMANYRPAQLKQERVAAFVVSTHGDGDPPDDAELLYEFLHDEKAKDLSALRYAVLALGDSSYSHFCQTGKDFDARLAALGAQRFHHRVDCDVDFTAPATAWRKAILDKVKDIVVKDRSANAARPKGAYLAVVPHHDESRPFPALLLTNQKITGRDSLKDVRHLELSLEGSGLSYEPGDSLSVLPRNAPDLVKQVLAATRLDGDTAVRLDGRSLSLAAALTEQRELTLVTKPFLTAYNERAPSAELAAVLDATAEGFTRFVTTRQVLDVLQAYPIKLAAQDLVDMLRPLAPRRYSIASSPLQSPGEAHLTVALVRYHAHQREQLGAASSYLAERRALGDTIPVSIARNPRFRLPDDPDVPIIMVGPGTGVAPFRAFLQHREATGASGRNWLFFGAQHFRSDFLYQIEWLRYRKQGMLTRMNVAFSRDQPEKVYVQHRMREHAVELYAWLRDGAYFYVCGDAARMAKEVDAALRWIVAEQGKLSDEQTHEFIRELKQQKRYQRDVY